MKSRVPRKAGANASGTSKNLFDFSFGGLIVLVSDRGEPGFATDVTANDDPGNDQFAVEIWVERKRSEGDNS